MEKEQLTSHFRASSVDLTVRRARSQRRVSDGGTGPGAAEVVPASDRRVRRKSSNGSIRRERVRTASFERTPHGKFGLQLTGPKHAHLARGSTTAANAVYVAGLAKDCGGQGQLNPGDRIVDVNGTEVAGLTVDAVNQLITATPANAAVRIRVVADPDGFAEQNMMERSSTPETSGRDSRDSNSAATVATPRSPLGGQPQPSLSPPGSTAGDSTSPQSQPQQPSPRMVPRKVVVAPAAAEAPSATPQTAPSNAATAPTAPTEAAVPTTTFAMSPSPSSFPASPPPPQRTSSSAVSQGSRGSSGSATGGASSEAADKRAQIKAERARAKAEKEAEKKRAKEQQEAEKRRAKEQLEAEKRRQKALKEEQKKAKKKSSKDSSGSADIPMAIPDIAPPESSFLFAKAAAPPPESSFLFAKRD